MARHFALVAVACVALVLTVSYWPCETANATPAPQPPLCVSCDCIRWTMMGTWVTDSWDGIDFRMYGNKNGNGEVEVSSITQAGVGYGRREACIQYNDEFQPAANWECSAKATVLSWNPTVYAMVWCQKYDHGEFKACRITANAGDFVQAVNLTDKRNNPFEEVWFDCSCSLKE